QDAEGVEAFRRDVDAALVRGRGVEVDPLRGDELAQRLIQLRVELGHARAPPNRRNGRIDRLVIVSKSCRMIGTRSTLVCREGLIGRSGWTPRAAPRPSPASMPRLDSSPLTRKTADDTSSVTPTVQPSGGRMMRTSRLAVLVCALSIHQAHLTAQEPT